MSLAWGGALGRVAHRENGEGGFRSRKSWAFLVGAGPTSTGYGPQFSRHRTTIQQRNSVMWSNPLCGKKARDQLCP